MLYFKHLINKFCFKVKSSNLFKFFFGCVFLCFFIPNVNAFSVANRELGYLTGTSGYNYSSATTWLNLPLTFGTEYSVYYTTNPVTTGNYGIAFGGLARIDLLKGSKTNVKIFVSEKIELKTIKGKESVDDVFYSMIEKKAIKRLQHPTRSVKLEAFIA